MERRRKRNGIGIHPREVPSSFGCAYENLHCGSAWVCDGWCRAEGDGRQDDSCRPTGCFHYQGQARQHRRRRRTAQIRYVFETSPSPLASLVVSVLDSGAEGPGFKSQPRRCRVTVVGRLFIPIVPLFTKQ